MNNQTFLRQIHLFLFYFITDIVHYNLKNVGHNTLPCHTPELASNRADLRLFLLTQFIIILYVFLTSLKRSASTPTFPNFSKFLPFSHYQMFPYAYHQKHFSICPAFLNQLSSSKNKVCVCPTYSDCKQYFCRLSLDFFHHFVCK
jgi:hypothetical protein